MTEEKSTAKCYSLDLTVRDKKTIKVFVYSKDGKDIVPSFEPHKVTNIKREKDYEGFLLKYENKYNKV